MRYITEFLLRVFYQDYARKNKRTQESPLQVKITFIETETTRSSTSCTLTGIMELCDCDGVAQLYNIRIPIHKCGIINALKLLPYFSVHAPEKTKFSYTFQDPICLMSVVTTSDDFFACKSADA